MDHRRYDDINAPKLCGSRQPPTASEAVEHCLKSDVGHAHRLDLASAPERGSQEPGTYQLYSNWDFNAAGAVFERLTGRDIYDELQAQLAVPLQFEDWDRSAQRKSGDLSISVNPARRG